MHWKTCCLCVLFLVSLTGCPEDFGKEGTIDRAIHQDVLDSIQKPCTEKERKEHCGPGNSAEECRQRCG